MAAPWLVNDSNMLATRTSTHELTLTLKDWTIEVENSDMFLNLRAIKVTTSSMSQLHAHGLIGQTWKRATYPTALKYIEGDVDDYLILDDSVFGTNFVYNKFQSLNENGNSNGVIIRCNNSGHVESLTHNLYRASTTMQTFSFLFFFNFRFLDRVSTV